MKDKILETKQYRKKGSPNFMQVAANEDMNDPKAYPDWFIDIGFYNNKSRKIKDSVTIIKNDLTNHMRMYLAEGWKEVDKKDYVDIFTKDAEVKK